MGVKFLKDQCQKEFQDHMIKAVKRMQDAYFDEIQSHMRTPEGMQDLTKGDVELIAGWITAQVIGGPWATLDQWGRGSLMDTSNPALQDYLFNTAKGWNPARHDLAIRGRPKGTYTDFFGRTRTSSGALEGRDLETDPPQKGRFQTDQFDPWPPSHAFTTATAWMQHTIIQKMLEDAIVAFPFHKYIVVTIER